MNEADRKAPEPSARLARQRELAAVDAVLGTHDWTARDQVGILIARGPELTGAAVLALHPTARRAASFRLRFKLLSESHSESRAAEVAALLRFARETSIRSGVSELTVENAPGETGFDDQFFAQGFVRVSAAVHFEGDLTTIRAMTRDLAHKTMTRNRSIEIVPLSSCSAADVFVLSAAGIGATGLGVRALHAGDRSAFESFSASCGALVDGKLRGAIVANQEDEPAFIEMLAVDGQFARLGLTVLLIDRCAERLLERGATRVSFNTGQNNSRMLRLAEDFGCRRTRRSDVWAVDISSMVAG